jgi:aromatic ring-opening dioxygenase catalytic subunit (LigB family)
LICSKRATADAGGRACHGREHPTEEHLLPLLVAYGATSPQDSMTVLDGGMDGVLSMDSFCLKPACRCNKLPGAVSSSL